VRVRDGEQKEAEGYREVMKWKLSERKGVKRIQKREMEGAGAGNDKGSSWPLPFFNSWPLPIFNSGVALHKVVTSQL
jgi:hypothetical protein